MPGSPTHDHIPTRNTYEPEISGAANTVADHLRHALDQLTAHFDDIRRAADRNVTGAAACEAALSTPLLLLDEALGAAEFVAEALEALS